MKNPFFKRWPSRDQAKIANQRVAFSLVELLVVVAIVGVLSTIAITSFNSTMQGTKLSSTAQALADAFSLAKSSAVTRNIPVQLRFYKLPDFDAASSAAATNYRAVQLFACESRSTNAITKPYLFPQPIVASQNTSKSSIFQLAENAADSNKVSGYGNYRYVIVTFGPDGMIRPATGSPLTTTNEWYVTLQTQRDAQNDSSWPKNFATVSINPITGATRVYQPR